MAETSRPWPGTTIGDAGPYSSNDWNDVWGATSRAGVDFGSSDNYNIGVLYQLGNALEPTVNGTDIDVDTGGSLVDGLYHENTATVSVPITASGVGTSRIDIIVVRKNYQQAVTYTPAGAAPTVPPRTARITVIRGTEAGAPVAPSLTQDTTRTTYWDIPLAQVEVSAAGVLSGFADLREYVDAETKHLFVPVLIGYNTTGVSAISLDTNNTSVAPFIELPDAVISSAIGRFIVPSDYLSDMTAETILIPAANGDVYLQCQFGAGACGESTTTHNGSVAIAAIAVTTGVYNCIAELDITGITPGDIVFVLPLRDATNILDTVNASVYVQGINITYFGWKK